MTNISLYIHYPFCVSKCPYCDFNSYCNIHLSEDKLLDAYLKELEYYKKYFQNKQLSTIYFGGGTPSLMSTNLLNKIFNKITKITNISNNCEITLEANPNSINLDKMNDFKNIGINRLSIGIQSLYDTELKKLGRIHNRQEGIEAIENAQKVFKDKYTIDLIYTRPEQKLEDWKKELEEAVSLSPYHISLYQLIIEKGTQFYKNKVKLPEENISIDFYNFTRDFLNNKGLNFYEISNYAKKGYESKHNLVYWQNGEWIGIGAGAHSRVNYNNKRYAIQNIKNPIKWYEKCINKNNGISIRSILSQEEIIEEFVLMGLRIKDGIHLKNLQKNIDCNSFYDILNTNNIQLLAKNNLLTHTKNNVKLTKKGFLLLNSIIDKVLY